MIKDNTGLTQEQVEKAHSVLYEFILEDAKHSDGELSNALSTASTAYLQLLKLGAPKLKAIRDVLGPDIEEACPLYTQFSELRPVLAHPRDRDNANCGAIILKTYGVIAPYLSKIDELRKVQALERILGDGD